jgi:predicted amidophosphoribosyltransferase
VRKVLGRLLDVLYPRRCAGCARGAWPFCETCRLELPVLGRPSCLRCGAPALEDAPGCRNCPPRPVARARAPFLYDGPVRHAVHRLKFGGVRAVADAFAGPMASCAPELGAFDAVTWVPLSPRRLAERGFDQAKALAGLIGRELDLPVLRFLERISDAGGTQARRGRDARREAIAGRYGVARRPPERVLLVDDVLTTGATAAACAAELVGAGADEVSVLVAARSVRPGFRPGYTRSGPALGSVVARGEVLR